MPLQKIVIVRHASRQDKHDPYWVYSALHPYDPPLSSLGFDQATLSGKFIAQLTKHHRHNHHSHHNHNNHSHNHDHHDHHDHNTVYIHTSPYLRCAQTAAGISAQLPHHHHHTSPSSSSSASPKLRFDSALGEWLTQNYFHTIDPPPEDDTPVIRRSKLWLSLNYAYRTCFTIDDTWDSSRLGPSGRFEESWITVNQRLANYTRDLIRYYSDYPDKITVIVVSHGVGCNAILGHLTKSAFYTEVPLASVSVATFKGQTAEWDLEFVSETSHLNNDNNGNNNNNHSNNSNNDSLQVSSSTAVPLLSLSSASSSSSLNSLTSSTAYSTTTIHDTNLNATGPGGADQMGKISEGGYSYAGTPQPNLSHAATPVWTATFATTLMAPLGTSIRTSLGSSMTYPGGQERANPNANADANPH